METNLTSRSALGLTKPSPVGRRSVNQRVGVLALIAVLAYLILYPVLYMQGEALGDNATGYRVAYGSDRIGEIIVYTGMLAVGSLVISLVLGTALAWAASRLPRRLNWLKIFPVLPVVLPAVASIVAWAFLLSPRPGYLNSVMRLLPWWSGLEEGPVDVYTLPWIVIITGFSLSSFVYLFVSAGLENVGSDVVEAAQMAGEPEWKTFFTITLPLLRPTFVYAGGVALLLGLGQFTAPLLLGTNSGVVVLTTEMYYRMTQAPVQFDVAAALGSPLVIVGVIVIFAQRVILRDQSRFVTHGGKAFTNISRPSWLAALLIIVYAALSSVFPLLALLAVALSPYWTGNLNPSTFSFASFETIFANANITEAIINSILYSLAAVFITLPIGIIVSAILIRGRDLPILKPVLDVLVAAPLAIPSVIYGAGFLIVFTQGSFRLYGTPWAMIIVYVTLMVPFATRMIMASMLSLGSAYVEASRVSGAGVITTYFQILLPLLRSSIAGAGALMFVLLTHEFSASVLVRGSNTQVMGTILFDYWTDGSYPLVAAIALVMTGVTAVGVALALLLGGSKTFERL